MKVFGGLAVHCYIFINIKNLALYFISLCLHLNKIYFTNIVERAQPPLLPSVQIMVSEVYITYHLFIKAAGLQVGVCINNLFSFHMT